MPILPVHRTPDVAAAVGGIWRPACASSWADLFAEHQGHKERDTRGYFVGSVVIAQNDNAGHHSTTVAPAIVSEKWAILS